jgi:hypothetical protein
MAAKRGRKLQAPLPSCVFLLNAFSSPEPVCTPLENALDWNYARKNGFHK